MYEVWSNYGYADQRLILRTPDENRARRTARAEGEDTPNVRVWTFTADGEAFDIYDGNEDRELY